MSHSIVDFSNLLHENAMRTDGSNVTAEDIVTFGGIFKQGEGLEIATTERHNIKLISQIPYNFVGGCAVMYHGELHIMGGASNSTSRNHFKYTNGSWQSVSQLINETSYGMAVVYNDAIYLFTPIPAKGYENAMTVLYKWDGFEWSYVEKVDDLSAYSYGSAVVYNDKIHVFTHRNHWVYDENGATVYGDSIPYDFNNGMAVVYDNKIHLIGGSVANTENLHYAWDGQTYSWQSVSTIPFACYGGSAVAYNDEIHVIGGVANSSAYYIWDGAEWTSIAGLSFTLSQGSAITVDEEIQTLYNRNHLSVTTLSVAPLHAEGKYNKPKDRTLLQIGNGTQSTRHNAFEVDENGYISTDEKAKIKFGVNLNGEYGYIPENSNEVIPFNHPTQMGIKCRNLVMQSFDDHARGLNARNMIHAITMNMSSDTTLEWTFPFGEGELVFNSRTNTVLQMRYRKADGQTLVNAIDIATVKADTTVYLYILTTSFDDQIVIGYQWITDSNYGFRNGIALRPVTYIPASDTILTGGGVSIGSQESATLPSDHCEVFPLQDNDDCFTWGLLHWLNYSNYQISAYYNSFRIVGSAITLYSGAWRKIVDGNYNYVTNPYAYADYDIFNLYGLRYYLQNNSSNYTNKILINRGGWITGWSTETVDNTHLGNIIGKLQTGELLFAERSDIISDDVIFTDDVALSTLPTDYYSNEEITADKDSFEVGDIYFYTGNIHGIDDNAMNIVTHVCVSKSVSDDNATYIFQSGGFLFTYRTTQGYKLYTAELNQQPQNVPRFEYLKYIDYRTGLELPNGTEFFLLHGNILVAKMDNMMANIYQITYYENEYKLRELGEITCYNYQDIYNHMQQQGTMQGMNKYPKGGNYFSKFDGLYEEYEMKQIK